MKSIGCRYSLHLLPFLILAGVVRAGEDGDMEKWLISRLTQRPADAANWRLLGRIRMKKGDVHGASQAFHRAVEIDPRSAAAQFDLGNVLLAEGRTRAAKGPFQQAIDLAPESDYARTARARLQEIGSEGDSDVTPASFKVDWLDRPQAAFSGADLADSPPFSLRLETGAIYNSNVGLSPISAELSSPAAAGFQGFLAPALEYRFLNDPCWRAGVGYESYFNINEADLSQFNLQHHQPYFFGEHSFFEERAEMIARLQYDFAYDAFAGHTFGTRHLLTGSLEARWDGGQNTVLYGRIDHTDFINDGVSPRETSRDGWTGAAGISHAVETDWKTVALLRGGVDVQWADLVGSNFAYRGVFIYAESEIALPYDCWLLPQVGWGYRNYPDFTLSPSRDELLWRAGAELRKWLTEHWAISGIFYYDRFDSQNEAYDADRYTAGIKLTYEY